MVTPGELKFYFLQKRVVLLDWTTHPILSLNPSLPPNLDHTFTPFSDIAFASFVSLSHTSKGKNHEQTQDDESKAKTSLRGLRPTSSTAAAATSTPVWTHHVSSVDSTPSRDINPHA